MRFNGYKYLINTKRDTTTYYQCSTYRSTQCKGKQIVKVLSEGEEMREILEIWAIASTTVIPGRLWDQVSRQLDAKYPAQAVLPMQRDEDINFIKYVWRQAYGGDEFRVIESVPTVCVSESDERSFVQFNVFYDNNGKRQRIIGMSHPDLIRL
ncbi:hypothetical protein PHPALM_30527 [Phytophthora palmivora]|uniref:FLYWCH-type domain-containing protein n=1 Tax=Phytophthora palmivora TaxID=4796 RepID=A0A2P4X4Y5_9STRA|nr:hypothetical protein PHPALM_30527 [Phytophthora palmivora]